MIITPPLLPLTRYNQFIVWKKIPIQGSNRSEKKPVHPQTLRNHDPHDPAIHMPADVAIAAAAGAGPEYGIGFVFTERDPFFFIDIDDCLNSDGWDDTARDLMTRFAGAAVEVSDSRTGLHIIACGTPPTPRRCKSIDPSYTFDLYTEGRFVALTCANALGDAWTDHTAALTPLVNQYLPPSVAVLTDWTDEPCDGWDGYTNDDNLINAAMASRSAAAQFSGRASFADLYTCNTRALEASFPSDNYAGTFDASRVDAALAQHLAFWTGKNCERIETLMRGSALLRDKWDLRPNYLPDTITRAVGLQDKVHIRRQGNVPAPVAAAEHYALRPGFQWLSPSDQIEYFRGCIYVRSVHKILVPDGELLDQKQFRAFYGGYVFALDSIDDKSTRNAWEAVTEAQYTEYPKVAGMRFLPDEPFGSITKIRGRSFVNTFTPQYGERKPGPVDLFLRHLELLLPDPDDRRILTSFLAGCVQSPGVKAQWCPVIQGTEGNGKTALYHALEYALGDDYCHQLDPNDVDSKFNAWIERKLIVTVEEIRTGGRYEVADRLKPLITNRRVPVQGKGLDQRTGDNVANFLLFSNHLDAVLKTRSDRRYCVFYTAQQSKQDLARDGMTSRYFDTLYDWLRGDGAAAVADYLYNYPISVNLQGQAPDTSSTQLAIHSSQGVAEQLIEEAVDMEEYGFRGGMISTRCAQQWLSDHRKNLSPQAVSKLLVDLGYQRHPALDSSEGKAKIDGITHRIYARFGSDGWKCSSHREVVEAWRALQRPAASAPAFPVALL